MRFFAIAVLSAALAFVSSDVDAAEKKGRKGPDRVPKTLTEDEVFRRVIARKLATRRVPFGGGGILRGWGDITSATILGPTINEQNGTINYCVTMKETVELFQLIQFNRVDLTVPVSVSFDRASDKITYKSYHSLPWARCPEGGTPFPEVVEARRRLKEQLGLQN